MAVVTSRESPKSATANQGIHTSTLPAPNDVTDYYRQTIDDYQTWSSEGYMHFGLWRKWLSPLNRQAMLEAMNDHVFDLLQLARSKSLVVGDFGCGLGAVSRYGSNRFPEHRWRAVTICPEQVAWGRDRQSKNQRQRVEIVQGDYRELPMGDDSLDAAFFLESLCHAPDIQQVLLETARVLRPGGRLVVVDGMMRNAADKTSAAARRLAQAVARNWAVPQFYSVPDFERAAGASGFSIERHRELGWQIAPCVAHTPLLVGWHSLRLIATGRWIAWKRRHMLGCALGVVLGLMRRQFGYYSCLLVKR